MDIQKQINDICQLLNELDEYDEINDILGGIKHG